MKKVATWQLHNENGKGMFKCRLANPTKNSKNIKGVTAKGLAYDYHAFLSSEVSGKLVWIDHLKGKFGNKFTVCLEQDNGIHIIEMDVNSNNLSGVVGCLLNTDYINNFFNFSYALLPMKDKMGNPVFNENKEQKTIKKVFIRENGNTLKNIYNAENPKPAEIKWTQNAKGEWDDSKEIIFWTNHIVSIQEKLIKNEVAIPFSINSFVFTYVESPFYKLVDPKLVEKGSEIYKEKRPTFQFMYETKKTNASSVFDEEEVSNDYTKPKDATSEFTDTDETEDDLPF